MPTVPTLPQLAATVAALQISVPQIQKGLNTTMQQHSMTIESELQGLANLIGVPANTDQGTPSTGLFLAIDNLLVTTANLQTQITTLSTSLNTLSVEVNALQSH